MKENDKRNGSNAKKTIVSAASASFAFWANSKAGRDIRTRESIVRFEANRIKIWRERYYILTLRIMPQLSKNSEVDSTYLDVFSHVL